MLYKNAPIVLEQRELVLTRNNGDEIRLRVSAISVGVKRDFDLLWPRPMVPTTVTEGKSGRQEKENWNDPKFQAEIEERSSLNNIYLMYRVLERDENLAFDNKPTDKTSLRALAEEVKNSGFSEGDVVMILKKALEASNLSQDEIEKAKSSF
jgi:hypothetical protein